MLKWITKRGENEIITFLNGKIFALFLPIAVFGAGIFLYFKLRLYRKNTLKTIFSGIKTKQSGEISPFKAMSVALAGTLGVGNIAGVASAIASGGAGAIFWMWVSAIVASVLKYGETLLALKHRRRLSDGTYTGGAYYYMKDSQHTRLALAFAFLCVLTSFCMGGIVQSNAIAVSLKAGFNIPVFVSALVIALLCFTVISGGFKKIAELTVFAVPILCLLYMGVSLYIIIANTDKMPEVLARIIKSAFSFKPCASGLFGFCISRAIRFGVARGILSNEAGSGTSVSAHAASDTKTPVNQAFFGMLEVFIDTIVLCSMTAFVILLAPEGVISGTSMLTAIGAYSHFLGNIAPGFMSTSVTFFAFGTIICWSVYGSFALRFLIAEAKIKSDKIQKYYYFVYSLFVLAGAYVKASFMWELCDFTTSVMTLINTGFLIYASGEIKSETLAYFEKRRNIIK